MEIEGGQEQTVRRWENPRTGEYTVSTETRVFREALADIPMIAVQPLEKRTADPRANLVGCSTGRSPGLAPLRILATYPAALRKRSI